jgi:diphthine-ammonia ligase
MCGIIGICNQQQAQGKVLEGLAAMQERGRDGYGLTNGKVVEWNKQLSKLRRSLSGHTVFGHALHAIVGCVPQPFVDHEKIFIANCEIYNWKELCESHQLPAKNDAHLLFLLLQKKKIEKVLALLDGPYAFAYKKGSSLDRGRQPMD